MKKKIAILLSVILVLPTFLVPLSSCHSQKLAGHEFYTDPNVAAIDFAIRLFQQSVPSDDSAMISPLSVLCALAMVANGADGNTLAQMEQVFRFSASDLNEYLHNYLGTLSSTEQCKFTLANSIWLRDDFAPTVKKGFLQDTKDYYGVSVFNRPFTIQTVDEINEWVKDNTLGLIDKILAVIPEDAVMYIINALALDAEWENIYKTSNIRDGEFTAHSGIKQKVEMMYSYENSFLDDGSATGFIKHYVGGRYAFAALLPNEGLSVENYIKTLSGQKLANTLSNAKSVRVSAAIPKFEKEYSLEMSDILQTMGISDAFSGKANFSKISDSALQISRVIHKTFITVDEKGTKAGAATLVEMTISSGYPPIETKIVHLDRPFVYMIIDCETNLPVFIGTVLDV
ncbi:MAG: serpin family protein [Dehalococcoidia bacterium]|nr:serpin family protein [Dehalococcoidia bacterium]